MKTVFADTGYWIAILNLDDGLHQTAVSVTASLSSLRIITSEIKKYLLRIKQIEDLSGKNFD